LPVRPWQSGLGIWPASRLRLTSALRRADFYWSGDLKAIAPFAKVATELNLYHGVGVGFPQPALPPARPETGPAFRSALTHSTGVAVTEAFDNEKSCARELLSL
jgi:hypothetical protein